MANLLRALGGALAASLLLAIPPAAAAVAPAPTLGGAVLHYLPSGLGTSSDFEYHFARVSFDSRVWESGSDARGWRVDLDIVVMHGRRLSTPRALHEWFIRYEQRPPAEARYRPVRVHGRRGWAAHDQVFWLIRPGAAVSVRIDRNRWSRRALFRTVRGVRMPWFPPDPVMTETGTRSNLAT
jgi:hypothetical protein